MNPNVGKLYNGYPILDASAFTVQVVAPMRANPFDQSPTQGMIANTLPQLPGNAWWSAVVDPSVITVPQFTEINTVVSDQSQIVQDLVDVYGSQVGGGNGG